MNLTFWPKFLRVAGVLGCLWGSALPPLRAGIERRVWTVDGIEREALVYLPEPPKSPAPAGTAPEKEGKTAAPSASVSDGPAQAPAPASAPAPGRTEAGGSTSPGKSPSGTEPHLPSTDSSSVIAPAVEPRLSRPAPAGPQATGDKAPGRPLVFIFHGHGGSMAQAVRSLNIHQHWPEAICVWAQGLPTPGKLTDPEGKRRGWQKDAGDQADRDLKFYDAMLASFLTGSDPVDRSRVFALGHSNGGAFTYLLWAERGETLAAVATSGAVAAKVLPKLQQHPKPLLAIAGRRDPLVRYAWQERMLQSLLRARGCPAPSLKNGLTDHPTGPTPPLRTFIHPAGHTLPPQAPAQIAQFFQSLPHTSQPRASSVPASPGSPGLQP